LENWIKLADRTTLQCDSPTAGLITDYDDTDDDDGRIL